MFVIQTNKTCTEQVKHLPLLFTQGLLSSLTAMTGTPTKQWSFSTCSSFRTRPHTSVSHRHTHARTKRAPISCLVHSSLSSRRRPTETPHQPQTRRTASHMSEHIHTIKSIAREICSLLRTPPLTFRPGSAATNKAPVGPSR